MAKPSQYCSMVNSIIPKWVLISLLVVLALPHQSSAQQPKGPDRWPRWQGAEGWPKWPDQDWLDSTLKDAGKKLDIIKGLKRPGPDIDLLQSKAADLLKQANQAKNNFMRCGSLATAANSMLDAAYSIFYARKSDDSSADFWGVGRILQGFLFRVQQADVFAQMNTDKNSDQYVTLARSLYQQARSAYDAREYLKAKYLVDASSNIVTALESIVYSQASIPPPPTPGAIK